MRRLLVAVCLVGVSIASLPGAQPARSGAAQPPAVPHITTPKEALGFDFGDDYQLADYRQIEAYWRTLDKESDRMVLHDMGKTAAGRARRIGDGPSPRHTL